MVEQFVENMKGLAERYVYRELFAYTVAEFINKFNPQPGDLVECARSTFCHWAVYVGGSNHTVIHFDGTPTKKYTNTGIRKTLLKYLEEDGIRVNNSLDREMKSLKPKEIVAKAEYYLKHQHEIGQYDLVSNNCEHFATRCRYGKAVSKQMKPVQDNEILAGACRLVSSGSQNLANFFGQTQPQ